MKKKKTVKEIGKLTATIFSILFVHFRFLGRVGFVVSQWVCFLAVLEPRFWMPYAHSARWLYATYYIASLIALVFAGLLVLKLSTPTRLFVVRWYSGLMYSATMLFFLFDERFRAALLLSFGWNALAIFINWLLPFREKDDKAYVVFKNWAQKANAVAQPVFFLLLVGILALHSILLSTALFTGIIGYMTFLLLRSIRETFRET